MVRITAKSGASSAGMLVELIDTTWALDSAVVCDDVSETTWMVVVKPLAMLLVLSAEIWLDVMPAIWLLISIDT